MFASILRFELRYHFRQPVFWLVGAFFALMTFFATSSESVTIGGGIGNVHRNAPFVVVQMLGIMSVIGVFIVVAFMASAALRDFERGTHELVFSKPVRRRDILLGRYVGSLLVAWLCFGWAAAGAALGSIMPWLDPERLGPFRPSAYLVAMLVFALPNFLFLGALFFWLASRTRSVLTTYLGVVGLFVAFFLSRLLQRDVENMMVGSLLDPFGMAALDLDTRYWTIVEKNDLLPPLVGAVLYNRLLWTTIGLAVLALTVARFRYARAAAPRRRALRRLAAEAQVAAAEGSLSPTGGTRPVFTPAFGSRTAWHQLWRQLRLELRTVIRSVPFLVILAFGMFNVVAGASVRFERYGTAVYPVTHLMLQAISGGYSFLLVIILTLYSGEMIWRERSLDLAGVFDSLPVPSWVPLAAKMTALQVAMGLFLTGGVVGVIGIQLFSGYHHLELGLYARGMVVEAIPFLLIAFFAFFVQIAANSKLLGYGVMIVYLLTDDVLEALHLEHHLYRFGGAPEVPYSDMNGFGHFLEAFGWYELFWALVAAILVGLSALLWVRGTDTAPRIRLALARGRFSGGLRLALPLLAIAAATAGAWIVFNTTVVNEYVPADVAMDRQAAYEKAYRQYRSTPLPRITAVRADVDIFPEERRVAIRGHYQLRNRHEKPIDQLHVAIPRRVTIDRLSLPPHTVELEDRELGYAIYRLETPLAPGEECSFDFDLTVANPGFENDGSDTSIVANGTFFNNRQYFPVLGYDELQQLTDRNERRRRGLPPVLRMAKVDDLEARRDTYVTADADWIDFETTVSTSADQIAIAPGYLQREWREGDRRYFHYAMDAPILHFFAYVSARYEVLRERWRDVDIEIYYHPGHEYNLERMVASIRASLDYLTESFSPYQHRQVRIIEFPRYESFAQSFPNTIPYSESLGFIARLDDDDDTIDYPFYVTAHEVAHQWWAHQVIGGNVQGATLLSETMAQYSALMIMRRELGADAMKRFLGYELDQYLQGRGNELVEEMPLLLVEDQPYIHYRKGSVVMYALADAIGEEHLNDAFRRYVEAVAFQQPPYTNSLEWLDFLRTEVPGEKAELVADLLETITLYENEAVEASWSEREDGRYDVRLVATARKIRADGQGHETEIALDDWVDVGVFGEDADGQETVLLLEPRRVTAAETTFEVVVDQRPVRAGVDPYHKLIDRNPRDNVRKVERGAGRTAVGG